MMSYNFTGEWNKINAILGDEKIARHKLYQAKMLAMRKTTAFFSKQIKLNIRSSGNLAGAPFKPNSLVTIARKGGKSKPLIDTGDMFQNVTHIVVDEDVGFVGLKRGQMHKGGDGEIQDIAEKNEEERPFIGPVLNAFSKEAGELYAQTIMDNLFI